MFLDGLWDPQSDSAVQYNGHATSSRNADIGASDQMWLDCLEPDELDALADNIQLCLGTVSLEFLAYLPAADQS
jgi:hypothetical protein